MIPRKYYPSYLGLVDNGELERRAKNALEQLARCEICPRRCKVNRLQDNHGFCRTGRLARVASYFPHHGEEDCLRGWRGSGTIFFSGCNLRCAFCQNWDISQQNAGAEVTAAELAAMMLELQDTGVHNINWVTPSHVVPQLLEATAIAARNGLCIPIVYNSGGYDSVTALTWLAGFVDIFMPDFKYWNPATANLLSSAPDYPEVARTAVREMHRQVGDLELDEQGLARRGLLIRHLVLPGGMAGTADIAA
ncbi:MAG: 4Fe-4S cluster-binding domain-containing protein, partial [Verrucomicrobiae bacterium]|nr:4Fe-4S cluster-binding domain-containing protein [Verrucomicrobiae bacterium]